MKLDLILQAGGVCTFTLAAVNWRREWSEAYRRADEGTQRGMYQRGVSKRPGVEDGGVHVK